MATDETPTEARLTLLGRAMLETGTAGLTDAMIRKAYRRIDESMDATEVKQFQHKGDIIEAPAQVAWAERTKAAELTLRMADHMPSKLEHQIAGNVAFSVLGLDNDKV